VTYESCVKYYKRKADKLKKAKLIKKAKAKLEKKQKLDKSDKKVLIENKTFNFEELVNEIIK